MNNHLLPNNFIVFKVLLAIFTRTVFFSKTIKNKISILLITTFCRFIFINFIRIVIFIKMQQIRNDYIEIFT